MANVAHQALDAIDALGDQRFTLPTNPATIFVPKRGRPDHRAHARLASPVGH